MEFKTVKEGKRIIGLDLIPEEYLWNEEKTREEIEFCKNLPRRIENGGAEIYFIIGKRIEIGIRNRYDNGEYSFKVSDRVMKGLKKILRIGYTIETTEDNIFTARINKGKENGKGERFPGSKKARKARKKSKKIRKGKK